MQISLIQKAIIIAITIIIYINYLHSNRTQGLGLGHAALYVHIIIHTTTAIELIDNFPDEWKSLNVTERILHCLNTNVKQITYFCFLLDLVTKKRNDMNQSWAHKPINLIPYYQPIKQNRSWILISQQVFK